MLEHIEKYWNPLAPFPGHPHVSFRSDIHANEEAMRCGVCGHESALPLSWSMTKSDLVRFVAGFMTEHAHDTPEMDAGIPVLQ